MKFSLQKAAVNPQGYTPEGYYFGHGIQLWIYSHSSYDEEQNSWVNICEYLRAPTREEAKEHITKLYPQATFHR